jgi:hypothetical protein
MTQDGEKSLQNVEIHCDYVYNSWAPSTTILKEIAPPAKVLDNEALCFMTSVE